MIWPALLAQPIAQIADQMAERIAPAQEGTSHEDLTPDTAPRPTTVPPTPAPPRDAAQEPAQPAATTSPSPPPVLQRVGGVFRRLAHRAKTLLGMSRSGEGTAPAASPPEESCPQGPASHATTSRDEMGPSALPRETTSNEETAPHEPTSQAAPPPEATSNEGTALTVRSRDAAPIARCLGVLVGRLMNPGGWVRGERRAGAEPIWTDRRRPYDESTVRKQARVLAQCGGSEVVARTLEMVVEEAVAASGEKAVAYTDIYDQVLWTKKPAYAAPIGNRGNRLLAATYFGLTFVRPKNGPVLAYSISWHKPASPLQDALVALHAAPRRASWLATAIRCHIWDRGGSGRPTLRWALARHIPYLTVTRGSTHWTRYRRRPDVYSRRRLPVFVRRDATLARRKRRGTAPEAGVPPAAGALPQPKATAQEVIFPAHPDKGRASTKALRYKTSASLSKAELRQLDRVYKTRWPSNENPIKFLVAVGFDRNLDRGLTPTTSRGTDGRLVRLEAREHALHAKIAAFKPTTVPQAIRAFGPLWRQKKACAQERAELAALPKDKGARMPTGAELLCKNLILLMYNTLVLLLMRSPLKEVQAMSPSRVHELLLGRSVLVDADAHGTILSIDPMPDESERLLQEELVRLLNAQSLSIQERRLYLRLNDPPAGMPPLRVFG